MKIKQNFLTLICFVSSLLGLTLIYIAAINLQPTQLKIGDITPEMIGRSVTTSGYIVYKNEHSAGHVFLTISDNGDKIQVPLFSGFMSKLNEAGIYSNDFKKGVKISVTGLVDEYQGQLQIIPRKVEDIKLG